MANGGNDSSNPLSGLNWSPTWHPISVSSRTANSPPSLSTLSMATVIQYPDLVEEICAVLPTHLRRNMIAMALEQKMVNSVAPLIYAWTEPVLSLKSIFPTIYSNPELVGDMQNQVEATKIGCVSVTIVIQLLIQKVISILVKNPRAVKCLDLSGFPVLRTTLEELFQAKFNPRESLTIILDIWIPEQGSDDSNWIKLLNGSKNFTLKVENIYICSKKEAVRNKVISSCLRTNENVKGLKLSSLNFADWPEVSRTLSIIRTCSKISMLDLSRNNIFDSSPNDQVGRCLINKILRSLPLLARLDLSHNLLTDQSGQVLTGLSLSYLNLTASHLSPGDLQHLVSLSTLVHLDLSQNSIGDAFSQLVPKSNMLVNLEILEMEDCFLSPSNFDNVLSFIKSCPNLKILNISYNTLELSQILRLIQLRLEVLLVFSKMVCNCTTTECTCYEEGQLVVSYTLTSEGYDVRSFDKETACQAIETASKFILFKAFLSPEL